MSTAAIKPWPGPSVMSSPPRMTRLEPQLLQIVRYDCPSLAEVERVVRVAGLRLQIREAGSGPPLLLLNGIGAHLRMWEPLEHALGGVRVLAFDAPGTGRSQTPAVPLTLDGHARVAEEVLDALGQ